MRGSESAVMSWIMEIFAFLDPTEMLIALAVAALAGFIKGVVGFAMPMILVSGLSTFLAPELALAGLILPTLVANGVQALGQGWRAAFQVIGRFGVFLGTGFAFLLVSAQMVRIVHAETMLLVLGGMIGLFAFVQLMGWKPTLVCPGRMLEGAVGAVAGTVGGVSGIWGPPTVAYLTALGTSKSDQIRIQGVIYGLGSVALLGAHVGSGVLRAETAPFSAVLVVPAVAAMWLGTRVMEQIDQATFRSATLVVLLVAGLNLVRRGLFG